MAKLYEDITSIVWGNQSFPVSQEFGTYNPGTADMYQYAADVGWPAGTHVGLDVAVPYGTDIHASESGVVEQAGFSDSFRPYPVYVREDDGDLAIYGHLSNNTVRIGDEVDRGDLLGKSGEQTYPGTTIPDTTGPHIHFELRNASGKAIDPTSELSGTGSLSNVSKLSLSGSWGVAIPIIAVGGAIAVLIFGLGMFRG